MTAPAQKLSKRGIGASQVAAVLGHNPYSKSLVEPWEDILGLAPPREETKPQRWGKRLEAAVRQEYSDVTGETLVVPPASLFHPEHPWRRATPDGLVVRQKKTAKTVQIKTTDAFMAEHWGPDGSSEVPIWVALQCVWELHVLSAQLHYPVNESDVAVLIGGNDFRIYHLALDQELEQLAVEGATDFWERFVVPQVPPPVDASAAYREHLARRWAKVRGELAPASKFALELVGRIEQIRTQAAELAEEHALLENQLLLEIADAGGIEGVFGKVHAKPQTRDTTNWQAVAKDIASQIKWKDEKPFTPEMAAELLADVAKQHTKTSAPFRPLRFPRGFPRKPFGKDD